MSEVSENTEIPAQMASSGEAQVKVEDVVTKELVSEILKGYCNSGANLELVDYEVKEGTQAGDNYMSIMYALKLNLKNSSTGETEIVPIMLKVLPQNEMRKKLIMEQNIFVRDVSFYQKLAPAMEKFQKDAGLSDQEIFKPWPKCYASKTDGENDFLAMEDLKKDGFVMASRIQGLDFEHSKLVVKTLAKFHAVSYAMFQGDYDEIIKNYPWTQESIYHENTPQYMKDMFQQVFTNQEDLLKQTGEEKAAANVGKLLSQDFFAEVFKIIGCNTKWSVINHGDCWTNNMLFLYDEETKKPIDVKIVDYQICRASSRAVDLHYFFYSSPKVEVLNEKENELEQIYFQEFTDYAIRLGIDVVAHELTWENFMKEIEKYRYFGCVSGLMMAMMMSADSSDIPDMEQIKEEDFKSGELTKTMTEKFLKGKAVEKIKNMASNHLPKCPQIQDS